MSATPAAKPVFLEKFMQKIKKIKFGFPWEYLREGAVELFQKAGYKVEIDEHSYRIEIDDPEIECITSKVEELAPLVEKGIVDVGITEKAFILDSKAKVVALVDLDYGYNTWRAAKIVLAVPANSKIKSVKDLEGKRIATWVPEIATDYLKKHRVKAEIEFTNMRTETICPGLVDGIIEFINTGVTLTTYKLKIIDTLMETSPWLIANKKAWEDKWKREKIENLAMLLKGARLAQEYAGLMLHASNDMMAKVLKALPSLKKPTVTHLRGENWFDVLTVAKKKKIRELIPKLKKIGCTDIVEFPLNKVIV